MVKKGFPENIFLNPFFPQKIGDGLD